MTRIATFCLVSSTLAALALSASSGADAGKIKAAGTGRTGQIPGQQEGNPNRPVVIGGVYNGGSNPKVKPGNSNKLKAPLH
jgi:hypothetical protein